MQKSPYGTSYGEALAKYINKIIPLTHISPEATLKILFRTLCNFHNRYFETVLLDAISFTIRHN